MPELCHAPDEIRNLNYGKYFSEGVSEIEFDIWRLIGTQMPQIKQIFADLFCSNL